MLRGAVDGTIASQQEGVHVKSLIWSLHVLLYVYIDLG